MPGTASLLPTALVVTMTAGLSLAAAMGGVRSMLPVALARPPISTPTPVAPTGPPERPGPSTLASATPRGGATAAAVTAAASTEHAEPAPPPPACAARTLPPQAQGAGPRCDPGPPSTVPGHGQPGMHGTASPAPVWFLWHGNVFQALLVIDNLDLDLEMVEHPGSDHSKLLKSLREFAGYLRANASSIPNYGELHRAAEMISTAFAESTVNQVVSKRMVKKQQMRWTPRGAHLLLQIRTRVLNDELAADFHRWYSGFTLQAEPPHMAA